MTQYIGLYEIRGELGRGAMAVVWRAFDPKLEREVAIKEPHVPPGLDPHMQSELAERFVREGRAAAGLNHPGIVTIYSADIYDGRPAIVMELIEGEPLSDTLARGRIGAAAAREITGQLLDAVGYAHSKLIVHRDIKPDNIFLTHDGRVKLADFGIAHVGEGTQLTQQGTVMGTPGYMSPEQVMGQPADSRSDLFAIGVVAYEMLAGTNPFGATDGIPPTSVMYRIAHEQPAEVNAIAGDVDQHFAAVIMTALAKDPAQRFADAASFKRALAGETIVTAAQSGVMPAVSAPAGFASAPTVQVAPSAHRSSATPYWIVGGVGLVAVVIMIVVASGRPGGGSGGGVAGGAAGTVTLTSPADGATVSEGQELNLAAAAQGLPTGTPVVFEVDGKTVSEDVTAPYEAVYTVPANHGDTLAVRVSYKTSGGAVIEDAASLSVGGSAAAAPTPAPSGGGTSASSVNDEDAVRQVISEWLNAWRNENLGSYMNYYAADAECWRSSKSAWLSKSQWRSYKADVFSGGGTPTIDIDTPQVTVSGSSATAVFYQRYRSANTNDNGTKTLTLTKSGGRWQISREYWEEN